MARNDEERQRYRQQVITFGKIYESVEALLVRFGTPGDPRIRTLRVKVFRERLKYLRVYGIDRWRGGGGDEE